MFDLMKPLRPVGNLGPARRNAGRKYVTQAGAGGPIEPAMLVAAEAAPPVAPAAPMPPGRGGDAGNALQQALEAQQRAEAMQRDRQHAPQQQAQPQSIEEYIDRLPDLSEHERGFLRQHPALLHPRSPRSCGASITKGSTPACRTTRRSWI